MGTPLCLLAIISKGDYFDDFLTASLDDETL